MMQKEFEERTGIYIPSDMYSVVEEAYYEFDGDKDAFCKAYKENKDGLAQKIQRQYSEGKPSEVKKEESKPSQDEEEKWVPYVDRYEVSQADYERLASIGKQLSDEEAKQFIAEELGFDISKIAIIREEDELEVNYKTNRLRRTGRKIARHPYYEATDWYYVRFAVRTVVGDYYYEAYNMMLFQISF